MRQSAVPSLTGRCINSARAQSFFFFRWREGAAHINRPNEKLKHSDMRIQERNCHSLTVPNCPVACSKQWIHLWHPPKKSRKLRNCGQSPVEAPLCASPDRWSRAQESNSLSLSLSSCLPLLRLCLSRSWANKHEVMVTAALWYKSASGRGDALESNTVSSTELITQRGERGTQRENRGLYNSPLYSLQSVL